MFVLIPPSEGKAGDEKPSKQCLAPALVKDSKGVLAHLKGLSPAEQQKFYGVKQTDKAALVHAMNLKSAKAPAIPAIERYTGVVYQHLDFQSLRQKAYARKKLLFISAYFGLIPAGEAIPNYKLPINTWLVKYWRDLNSARLEALAKGKPVLNLLSQSYAKAVQYEHLITVDFRVAGGKKSAGHFGKAIKGKFLRYLMENKVSRVDDFDGFREDGYRWDGSNFVQQ